jgi:GlpG protein
VDSVAATAAPGPRPSGASFWQRTPPALATLLGLAIAVYLLGIAGLTGLAEVLTFQPFRHGAGGNALPELWRWVTPILLHFSAMHILFNTIVVWELGRRVELRAGAAGFVVLVLVTALVSNWVQFLWSGSIRFGGLSGVAYGLLGFVVVAARRSPDPAWRLPPGFAIALLVFLVLFSTGVTEAFGLYVANAAHWGGVLTGAAAAAIWPLRRA